MNKAAIFNLPLNYASLIHSYISRTGFSVFVTNPEFKNVLELKEFSNKIHVVSEILNDLENKNVEQKSFAVINTCPHLFVGKEWEKLCEKYGFSSESMRLVIRENLDVELEQQILLLAGVNKAVQSAQIMAVVLNEEFTPVARMLGIWARQQGIRLLQISNGIFLDGQYQTPNDILADVISVSGLRDQQALEDLGIASQRIIVSGNSTWMNYLGFSEMKNKCREALAKLLGWGTGPLILFGVGAAHVKSAFCDNDNLKIIVLEFISSFKKLKPEIKDSNWAILFAPEIDQKLESEIRDFVSQAGIREGEIRFFRNDPELFITSAKVVVSLDSSFLVEAIQARTRAINLFTELSWRMGPSFSTDSGILEIEAEQLASEIQKAILLPDLSEKEVFENQEYFNKRTVGNPVTNIVNWLASVA